MEEEIKQRLTSRDIWIRALYMVFFGIAYSVAELVIVLLVLFQFLVILFTGRANENALRLGKNVSAYVYQVFQFQTFNIETRPYPFSDWPDEVVEDNVWTADQEAEDELSEAGEVSAAADVEDAQVIDAEVVEVDEGGASEPTDDDTRR
jgi:hypothetical protein